MPLGTWPQAVQPFERATQETQEDGSIRIVPPNDYPVQASPSNQAAILALLEP